MRAPRRRRRLCWGRNDDGQLGDGTPTPRARAVTVAGIEGAISISAGERHTCAVTSAGAVLCWGADDAGQLGDGVGPSRATPRAVGASAPRRPFRLRARLLAARSCATARRAAGETTAGSRRRRRRATAGQLPTTVFALTGARALSGRAAHVRAARRRDGLVLGRQRLGPARRRLVPRSTAARPRQGLSAVTPIATGAVHTCAATRAAGLFCWGDNHSGQLGSTTPPTLPLPTAVPIVTDPVAVTAGAAHTCAVRLRVAHAVLGANDDGQLGEGSMSTLPEPVPVRRLANGGHGDGRRASRAPPTRTARSSAGATTTSASSGRARRHAGARDDARGGRRRPRSPPAARTAAPSATRRRPTRRTSSCAGAPTRPASSATTATTIGRCRRPSSSRCCRARLRRRAAHLRGRRRRPGSGAGGAARADSSAPAPARHALPDHVALPSGADRRRRRRRRRPHLRAGRPTDGLGALLLRRQQRRPARRRHADLAMRRRPWCRWAPAAPRATAVTAGGGPHLRHRRDRPPWCWGRGDGGQLGDGAGTNQPPPTAVTLRRRRGPLALRRRRAHLRRRSGEASVWCWGADGVQLGPAPRARRRAGRRRPPAPATSVSAGGAHSCASARRRRVWCWGANDSGQLGDGTTFDRPAPRQGRRRHGSGERRSAAHLRVRRQTTPSAAGAPTPADSWATPSPSQSAPPSWRASPATDQARQSSPVLVSQGCAIPPNEH